MVSGLALTISRRAGKRTSSAAGADQGEVVEVDVITNP